MKTFRYDSYYSFLEAAAHSDLRGRSPEWAGATYEEALRLARFGWPEGLSAILAHRRQVTIPEVFTSRSKRTVFVRSVAGFAPNIPAFIAGEPDCMYAAERRVRASGGRIIRIAADGSFAYSKPHDEVFHFGTKILLLIEQLEASGYSVELEFLTPLIEYSKDPSNSLYHNEMLEVKLPGFQELLEVMARISVEPFFANFHRRWLNSIHLPRGQVEGYAENLLKYHSNTPHCVGWARRLNELAQEVVGAGCSIKNKWCVQIPIKDSSNPLDLDRLAYCFAHPAFFRQLGLSAFETHLKLDRFRLRLGGLPVRSVDADILIRRDGEAVGTSVSTELKAAIAAINQVKVPVVQMPVSAPAASAPRKVPKESEKAGGPAEQRAVAGKVDKPKEKAGGQEQPRDIAGKGQKNGGRNTDEVRKKVPDESPAPPPKEAQKKDEPKQNGRVLVWLNDLIYALGRPVPEDREAQKRAMEAIGRALEAKKRR